LILQWRPALELTSLGWRARPIAPFSGNTVTRTTTALRASTPHEPTSRFGEFRKFFAAQLAIFVGIEFVEQSIRIRWCGATFRTTTLAATFGATSFTASTTAAAFAHGFACRLTFLVVQLAIAVGVKFLDHLLTHFAITARSVFLLGVRCGCWQEKYSSRQQQECFAHGMSPLCYVFCGRSAQPESCPWPGAVCLYASNSALAQKFREEVSPKMREL
jgi:hypothetical protein